MSNAKKILGVVIALAMILNIFAVSAFAAATVDDTGMTQAWSLGEPVKIDDTHYTVEVSLNTNYKVGPIEFQISNSDNVNVKLDEVDIETGAAIPASYAADITANNDTGKVTIVPSTVGKNSVETVQMNGVIAVLHFTLTSASANATIALVNAPKSSTSVDGTLIAARMSNDDLIGGTAVIGQEVTSVGTSVSIGVAAAAADLELKATAAAGIRIDTTKTFGGTYAGVVYGFTQAANNTFMNTAYLTNNLQASNGGSLAFSRSIGTAGYGTGTVITVKNADGSVAETYVVVIFGDVDGNGLINTTDFTVTKSAISNASIAPNNSVKRLAANCAITNNANIMHIINTNDSTAIKNHVSGNKLAAGNIATTHSNYTTFYK